MNIIKPYLETKCKDCDNNGFIIKDGIAVKCECRRKYESEVKAINILMNSGLLNNDSTYNDFKKLLDYDFSSYHGKDENGNIKKIKSYCEQFDKPREKPIYDDEENMISVETVPSPFKTLHCYVYGKQGTQKSTVMRGMLAIMARRGKNVYYIFAKDLISIIFDAERNEDADKLLKYIQNADILVIDEFDENRICLWNSGYKEKSLIVWLKNRLEMIRKSTWFISNYTIDELKNSKLGDLYGDLIDRETIYGRFEFKDRYFDDENSRKDIEKIMDFIWGD